MLNMVVTQRVNDGMENAFEALAREMTANTLAQDKGCLKYEWYRADAPQTYVLVESWTDRSALDAHFAAEHLRALKPNLAKCVSERFSAITLDPLT